MSCSLKQNSWILAERQTYRTGITIFESFKAWKRDSWESAIWPHSRAEQPLCERFQASKHDSWVSWNLSHFMNTLHNFHFRGRKTRFLNISKSTPLLDSTAHISSFHSVKPLFVKFSVSTILQNGNAIIWNFRDLRMPFLTISTSRQPISERFKVWKHYSWILALRETTIREIQ